MLKCRECALLIAVRGQGLGEACLFYIFSNLLRCSHPRLTHVLYIWFRVYAPPCVCCVGLVLHEHLVTELNTAPNNYCQNCNGMYLEALWNQKNIQNADRRFDLTVIRKYANNSLQSCKSWNGHDPAALGQRSNLPPFTSFLRWEATKPDSACPSAHLCRLLHNLHQT